MSTAAARPLPAHPDTPSITARAPRRSPDRIHRPFFVSAIAVTLLLGAGWGAWLLLRIGTAHAFTGVPANAVNAHGLAQVYGWVGLFILGFAYQFFPRLWRASLVAPRLAYVVFGLQLSGVILATLGLDLATAWSGARAMALAGGVLLTLASVVFAWQMAATARGGADRGATWRLYTFAALGFFVASTIASAWHGWITMGATTREQLVQAIGTWQAPLRDLQVHGLAMFMIFGVSIRLLPSLLGVPPVPDRRVRRAFWLLLASVIAETLIFLAYRFSGSHVVAALLWLPWIGLFTGAAMVAASLRVFRAFPDPDRSGKFIRAAYAWLFVSLAMLVLLPAYQAISHIPFSHAYYGATRHAITVGFVSLMIMGMAARFVAALHGHDRFRLPRLWLPFVLVNLGCFLRVTLQTAMISASASLQPRSHVISSVVCSSDPRVWIRRSMMRTRARAVTGNG